MLDNVYIFDCEVFAYDNFFVFKNAITNEYVITHNNNEAVAEFMKTHPLLGGYNNKHYDQFILKACLLDMQPEEVKEINDLIIEKGLNGWNIPSLKNSNIYFDQFDLMDDTQEGISLKDIEGHLGMDIRETTVPFDIDRPLTQAECEEVIYYCKHDVDATHILYKLRQVYLSNKLKLGVEKGLTPAKALYLTNAKMTAVYLDAVKKPHDDEREYVFPDNILWQYIPSEVKEYFSRLKDKSIPDDVLWGQKLDIMVGDCATTIGFGGIHGSIKNYREDMTETRLIKNADVGSYYPHLVTLDGYASRNIESVEAYANLLERRMKAKKAGDKSLADALKLVVNTFFGASGDRYNDLYDPLMFRSVCITGQLRLLELSNHLLADCPTLKVIQVNTDGIMCSFDKRDSNTWDAILKEWQDRTGFTLEEDLVKMICQRDVNSYVELPVDGSPKIKGGVLVRGVLTNSKIDFTKMGFPAWENISGGAFKINNNAVIVSKAVVDCIAYGTPVDETINNSKSIFDFQIIAKTWAKCGNAFHEQFGGMVETQRVNRVYAVDDFDYGTLMMIDPESGNYRKISGLPAHLMVDNDNRMTLDQIDKDWYIRLAKRYVSEFYGTKRKRKATVTKKVNKMKSDILALLEVKEWL